MDSSNFAQYITDNTSRFQDAAWFETVKNQTIILAGVGGIGSFTGFLLSRINPKTIYMYDPDTIELANLSGQLYKQDQIGKKKTTALVEFIKQYSLYYSSFNIGEAYTLEDPAANIMVCGFDNMEARKIFFSNWITHVHNLPKEERHKCLFIDGRLAAEELQIFCITGDDDYNINNYKTNHLFSDAQAEETICSYKQTTYMASLIGSLITNLFVNFCTNLTDNQRMLPFYTYYNALLYHFKSVN